MSQITNLAVLHPRIDVLRTLTNHSVSVALEVWWHRYIDLDDTTRDSLPVVEWKVVTFNPDHTVQSFRAPDLESALTAAESYHTLATPVGVVVTP
jgi:hypothetical protein